MTHIPTITDLSTAFCDLEHQLSAEIGFRLFSVLLVDLPDMVRIHSSNLEAYPLGGRKQMGPTPWGTHVITRGEPWLGQTLEELRNAFSDYDLIADLGCG